MPQGLNIGLLDRLITIQSLTVNRDPVFGAEQKSWATLAQVYAKVENVSGREFFLAKQVVGESVIRVTIRWRNDVTRQMRLVLDDGRIVQINAVLEKGRHAALELICTEVNT
jgi:SPP1 family predicted phage head-tail adaptor